MLGAVALLLAFQDHALPSLFQLRERVASDTGSSAKTLEADVRKMFGKGLATGAETRSQGTTVAFAVESAVKPTFHPLTGLYRDVMPQRIGESNVWVGVVDLRDGDGFPYAATADGKELGRGFVEVYDAEPETKVQPTIPRGTLKAMPRHTSAVFSGATRDWWVYTPPGLASGEEVALMVFQDGQGPKDWTPTVLDNLIAKGDMPKTVAVFLPPGTFSDGRSDRSFEYDTLSDAYARFLLEEILPLVEKDVKLSHDPAKRAICGISSGGICAFTAAWQRPDQFGKVVSFIGSFTDIASGPTLVAGGHNYPALIRKTDAKPIRVYLQDGRNDLDNVHGNWPLANQTMAAALKFKGYDHRFDYGDGNHSDRYQRAHFPSVLRWVWR